jgi:hypothetical protein
LVIGEVEQSHQIEYLVDGEGVIQHRKLSSIMVDGAACHGSCRISPEEAVPIAVHIRPRDSGLDTLRYKAAQGSALKELRLSDEYMLIKMSVRLVSFR